VALKDFAIVKGEPPLEDGVDVEFWDGPDRRTVNVRRAALDDTFDHLHGFRKPDVAAPTWRQMVEENLAAFERVVEAKYRRLVASSGQPVLSFDIELADIQGSGEKFTRDALLDAGIASPRTGTRRS
jgi:hypothetical protein